MPFPRLRPPWSALLLISPLAAFYISGLPDVPFHPDESTQLYASADFEQLWRDPLGMAWDPARAEDRRQHIRALDAPLTRYAIGLLRWLAGLAPLPNDWDWSLSWEQNRAAGALPGEELLWVARLAPAALFPLSLYLFYLAARALGGEIAGLAAIALLGTNALVLLHTRRAMAEGALLFGLAGCLAVLPTAGRRPWLAGLALAAAFNAKQSALALLPAMLLAAARPPRPAVEKPVALLGRLAQCAGAFLLVTLALNPLAWRQPLRAVGYALQARQELLARQAADVRRLVPQQAPQDAALRAALLLGHLYRAPLLFAEASNYQAQTAGDEAAYQANPFHTLWRGPAGSAALLALTLSGLAVGILQARRSPGSSRSLLLTFLLATALQGLGLVAAVPLAWQRYALPLVPFTLLWAAHGLAAGVSAFGSLRLPLRRPQGENR